MIERIDPQAYCPQRLLQDIQATCRQILAPFDEQRTRQALEVFAEEFSTCVVQLKATDKPGSGLYYRFFYNGPKDLNELAGALCAGQPPLQEEILRRLPGSTRAGLDFDSAEGLAKVWTFTGGPTPLERLLELQSLPQSLRSQADFLRSQGLRDVFFVASDFQSNTMNVYFGWDDLCRNPQWIERMVERTGGCAPCEDILRTQAVSGGVGVTFAWDRPGMQRWCLYSLQVEERVELPERLQIFAQAPSLNEEPQINLAWSFGGSRPYLKLEKSYARDARYFLTQKMGGDLRRRRLQNA
jgi:4-hydroxyphenylpyruvate 3-dimethylallyltransferase